MNRTKKNAQYLQELIKISELPSQRAMKYSDEAFLDELGQVNRLLKIGQEAPKTIDTNNPYNPDTVNSVAAKLIKKLEQTSSAVSANGAQVFLENLQSLSSLIDFLKKEAIQVNGKVIVTTSNPPDPKAYIEYQLPTGFGAVAVDQKVFIYKDGLISYLKSLQRQAVQEPNELLAAIVGRLISSSEKELQLKVAPEDKDKPKSNFPDDTPLDSLLEAMVFENPMLPSRDKGNVIITPGILKSKSSFDDFAKKIQLKKDNKITSYDEFTDDNFCDLIYVLWTRANSYNYRRGEPVDKLYLDLVTQLASQYQCNLQDMHKKVTPKTEVAGGYQQVSWKPGQPLPPQAKQMLSTIAIRYPLLPDRIDLKWIVQWIAAYQKIMTQLGVPVEGAAATTLDQAQGIMAGYGVSSQPLTDSAISIYRSIRATVIAKGLTPQQAIHSPMNYTQSIGQMLHSLTQVLLSFKRDLYDSLPDDWQALFDRQVDGSGSSLSAVNIRQVEQWIATMPAAMTAAEKGM